MSSSQPNNVPGATGPVDKPYEQRMAALQEAERLADSVRLDIKAREESVKAREDSVRAREASVQTREDNVNAREERINTRERKTATSGIVRIVSEAEQKVKEAGLICALAGVSISSDFTDSMIECQTRSTAIYDASASMEISQPLPMPQMVFEENGANLDPTSHAVRFWSAVQSGRVSFPDSQALFNVDTIGSELAGVYPWIHDALTLAMSQMEPVPWTVATFKKMFTILQGIAYLGYLVLALQIPGEGVQALAQQAESFLVAENLLQPGSILLSVFKSVQLALQGHTISTWLTEQGNCLDDSNCGLEKRCIAADDAIPGNFVFLDR
ncbi:MAG: hypothetical protein Q9226_007006 [Calogaya cf. arnoldii]